jgi:hypothetical protein
MIIPQLKRFVLRLSICGILLINNASVVSSTFQEPDAASGLLPEKLSSSTEFEFASQSPVLSTQEDVFVDQLAEDTWAYLHSDWATDNHLPWSWRSESMTGGDYANVTEIGFYALSWIAAYSLQRPWSPDWATTESEVTFILDRLRAWQTGSQAYQPHGPNAYNNSVFYQWYWISWSPPVVSGNSGDHLVPSVDNAWLAASLITIREYAEANNHATLAEKANSILNDMDFTLWYHYDTHRFSWGGVENPQGGTQADFFSNENRIINFVARALGQLSVGEFRSSLEALNKPFGTYNGITVERTAWDGSYFTYAGPALFIREMETTYGRNTILPATRAQIGYAQDQSYAAWGLSDSFDTGAGGYVQQGAPPVAMPGSPETRPGLVSPHAGALALITPLSPQAVENLQAMASSFDCYDPTYGFRDSVMAKPGAGYGSCSDRFSALAQEWIFLSIVNDQNGFIWKYFYRDEGVVAAHKEMFDPFWTLVWSDEFSGSGSIHASNWICDSGTGYPGGPPNWGTGEVQSYSCSTNNLFQSGGSLNIRALHSGTNPLTNWTSARIETVRTDFQPNPKGILAVEARIKLPDINNTSGLGYWPAFWMLGAPYRGNYWNWPGVGEIDIMENVNGLNKWWGVLHCGTNPGGPCNEPAGIASSISGFNPSLQGAFHTYRLEFDKRVSPQQLRWYVDGILRHTVSSNQLDAATWNNATNHGFFLLLNVAMGGDFPNGVHGSTTPTAATISGGTMQVDYVRVYHGAERDTAGVFRPSNGVIFLKNTNTSGFADIALNYGLAGDYPVVGDWDGNGTDTIGVYRSGRFLLRNSNTVGFAEINFLFGQAGDQPIAGDWNGDGVDTVGVYRPSTGAFYLRNSNSAGAPDYAFFLGNVGDVGIAGDWNGDGIDTTGVFRPSNGIIFLKNTNTSGFADIALNYGLPGDRPVVGDWDDDGDTTIGIFRKGRFYLRNSNTNGFADIVLDLGFPTDMPIAGNWDGLP